MKTTREALDTVLANCDGGSDMALRNSLLGVCHSTTPLQSARRMMWWRIYSAETLDRDAIRNAARKTMAAL